MFFLHIFQYLEPIKTTITIPTSKPSPKKVESSKKEESSKVNNAQSESAKTNSSTTVPASKSSPKKSDSPKPVVSPKPSTEKANVNSSTQSAKKENGTTLNGTTATPTIPATLNLIKNDKGLLPKATVKPNVLQHVIEGHVIQEANEPFPVTRQRLHAGGYADDSDAPPTKRNRSSASSPEKPATTPNSLSCKQCGKKEKSKYKPYCSKACTKSAAKTAGTPTIQQNGDHKLRLRNGTENGTTNGSMSPKSLPSPTSSSASTNGTNSDTSSNGSSDASSIDNKKLSDSTPMEVSTDVDSEQEEPISFLVKWSVDEVCDYIRSLAGYSDYAEDFANHEIDGQALVLLNENHLVNTMNIKLGPALKIMSQIEAIKKKGAPQTEQQTQ